jgi:hypothetical protein
MYVEAFYEFSWTERLGLYATLEREMSKEVYSNHAACAKTVAL